MVLTVLLIIIYLAFISLGLPDSLLGAAWPSMYPDMKVPISYAGIVSMIISGGTIVSSLFSDRLIRKSGTGLVAFISTLTTSLALFGFSFSKKFYMLCLFAIPLGLGAGAIDAALNNFVALYYKAKHMSWLHCFWGVGAMTGPVIMSYFLTQGYAFRLGYRTVAIIQLFLSVVLIASLPFWKKAEINSTTPPEKGNQEKGIQDHKIISKKELLKLPEVKQALTAFFCYCSIEATMGLWGSSFAVIAHGVQTDIAARWASLFYFGITFGRFLSGFVTLKLNNRQMVLLGEALIAAGMVMIMLPFGKISSLVGFILAGIGCAPIFPSLLHETPANFGAKYSQSVMGLQMASAYIGTTFIPPLFGALALKTSYLLLPFFTSTVLVLMFIMVNLLNKRVDEKNK